MMKPFSRPLRVWRAALLIKWKERVVYAEEK